MSQRRRRTLTQDEQALWAHVTRHVANLPGRKPKPEPALAPVTSPEPPAPPHPGKAKPVAPTLPPYRPAPPAPPPIPPLAPLERRLRQRLSRGNHPIEAVIDLHGLRQGDAHDRLRGFLLQSQAAACSVVLVVTGKGGQAAPGLGAEERGVLRRMVPHWLRMPDLRGVIVGFEEAAPHHGGAGALYVRLRRRGQTGGAP